MSVTFRILSALALVGFASACAPKPEPVTYQQPPMVEPEPEYNKYG